MGQVYFEHQGFELQGEVVKKTMNFVDIKIASCVHLFRCHPKQVRNTRSPIQRVGPRIRVWQRVRM